MARIFIAILFDDEVKNRLVSMQDALKKRGVRGDYCPYGNLHMTLAFVGEKRDMSGIREAVSEVEFEPFFMTLGGIGTFPTKSGVIWCGVKECEAVKNIASALRNRLDAHGVSYSRVEFVPHISLVQHPSKIIRDIEVPETLIRVEKICVMKSERVEGELTYTEV